MTRTGILALTILGLSSVAPTLARAETPGATLTKPAPKQYAFGMRVGGYGFRNKNADKASDKWNDCRMNGVGVFAQRELSHNGFVEAASDFYFADNTILGGQQPYADRLSGLFSVAGGLRMFPTSRISAFAQIGVGLELTRVTLAPVSDISQTWPDGSRPMLERTDSRALPMGFVGFGGDLRLGSRARLGMTFRTNLMGHFEEGAGQTELKVTPEAANQVQFYLRYAL